MHELLPTSLLRPPCASEALAFETTAELEPLPGTFGHDRALEALRVGLGIRREGYNIFVVGSSGVGKHTVVVKTLEDRAKNEATPPDWCYVQNFDESHRPKALKLPAGEGTTLKAAMTRFVADLRTVLPVIFTSDTYTSKVNAISEAAEKVHDQALDAVKEHAIQRGLALVKTEDGLTFLPAKDGEVIAPEAFEALPDDERKVLEGVLEETEDELQAVFGGVPRWRKETRDRLQALEREVVQAEVERLMVPVRQSFGAYPEVVAYLDAVANDIPDQIHLFREDILGPDDGDDEESEDGDDEAPADNPMGLRPRKKTEIRRYQVNVLVDHSKTHGAPVIHEDIPAFANLIGRIEHMAEFGALSTDHTLIKAGAFHLASGGYLVLDAWRLVNSPFAWAALKRVLRSRLVRMDAPDGNVNPMTTVMLTPDPLPVDVKVVVMGPAELYYELCDQDPEVERHFKILAAFEERFPRTVETTTLFARLIATKVAEKSLRTFRKDAVARVIEEAAREVEDNEYLSANLSRLFNLLDEADFWAGEAGSTEVHAAHVARALDAYDRRSSAPRDDFMNSIERGSLIVRTHGTAVGQVNGLAVVSLASFEFGRVSRISATARAGHGEVVDIERESDLSGSLHAKGVLILQSLLGARYSADMPLSLSASLTFEQSYGYVDGDSASLGEYCALISAIAEVPLSQAIALTGSVNQNGEVQAVGGVNAKIEGFFEICRRRGLTGQEGVIIPRANAKNLMLAPEIVEAAEKGLFRVWLVSEVDDALALLTGLEIGLRGPDGRFPAGTLHARVDARLRAFHDVREKRQSSALTTALGEALAEALSRR
jgi:lon-related putative ATP-dependent protease